MPGMIGYLRDYNAPQSPYDTSLCLSIPSMIPVIVGALQMRAYNFTYTEDTAFDAVQAIREVQVSVINGLNRLDDIYRVLDTGFNGTVYTDEGDGVITPPIPTVPRVDFDGTTQSIRKLLHDIRERLESENPDLEEIQNLLNLLVLAVG